MVPPASDDDRTGKPEGKIMVKDHGARMESLCGRQPGRPGGGAMKERLRTPAGIEIAHDGMPEARRRLAAMPRAQLEDLTLQALTDGVIFCATASALEAAITEALEFLCKGQTDAARRRLEAIGDGLHLGDAPVSETPEDDPPPAA